MNRNKIRFILYIGISLAAYSVFVDLNNGFAQNEMINQTSDVESNQYVQYLQTARNLLNQASTEYKDGNLTGAEELAIVAYLDNFEYVEQQLEKKGAQDLMEDIEQMMREKLRQLIQDKASDVDLELHINATDAKLQEAINILNVKNMN